MGFIRSDDPDRDFDRWDDMQWKREQRLPVCSVCGDRIYDEYAYCIKDDLICDKCIQDAKEYIDIEEDEDFGY